MTLTLYDLVADFLGLRVNLLIGFRTLQLARRLLRAFGGVSPLQCLISVKFRLPVVVRILQGLVPFVFVTLVTGPGALVSWVEIREHRDQVVHDVDLGSVAVTLLWVLAKPLQDHVTMQ